MSDKHKAQQVHTVSVAADVFATAVGLPIGLALPGLTIYSELHPAFGGFRIGALLMGDVCITPVAVGLLLVLRRLCSLRAARIILALLALLNIGLCGLMIMLLLYGIRR